MSTQEPRRALVIGAHPDDNEFGAGGFTAKLAQQGWEVTVRNPPQATPL